MLFHGNASSTRSDKRTALGASPHAFFDLCSAARTFWRYVLALLLGETLTASRALIAHASLPSYLKALLGAAALGAASPKPIIRETVQEIAAFPEKNVFSFPREGLPKEAPGDKIFHEAFTGSSHDHRPSRWLDHRP